MECEGSHFSTGGHFSPPVVSTFGGNDTFSTDEK